MKRKSVAIASILALTTAISAIVPAAQAKPLSPTQVSWAAPKEATMRLTPTTQFTATGERILNLDLIVDSKLVARVQAVSGKPGVQNFRLGRDSKAGSREPLPQGVYRVGAVDRNGGLPAAMGDTFIPITPLFSTARTGIGIHRDADRAIQGGSGTIGCLGILSQAGIDTVAKFVNTYRVKTLTVDYGIGSGELATR